MNPENLNQKANILRKAEKQERIKNLRDVVSRLRKPASVRELAKRIGMSPETTQAYLSQLLVEGEVKRIHVNQIQPALYYAGDGEAEEEVDKWAVTQEDLSRMPPEVAQGVSRWLRERRERLS